MLQFEDYKDKINLGPYPHESGIIPESEKDEICDKLLKFLLKERQEISGFNLSYANKRKKLERYITERPNLFIPDEIISLQDRLLWSETLERGTVDVNSLEYIDQMALYHGSIIDVAADAVVNSANPRLSGCNKPFHICIDNIIHNSAGMQLRRDCATIINLQGHEEECGEVKVTNGYNLPVRYVFHTVGPRIDCETSRAARINLRSCYLSCLDQAKAMGLKSIVFGAISTGPFAFPYDEAAEIATGAVLNWLRNTGYPIKVIFCVYLKEDAEIYDEIFKSL